MKKIVTHFYRGQTGIVRPYYIAMVEPFPCGYCTGRKKIPTKLGPKEKKDD